MNEISKKYPRTMHMPFSPGATSDDKFISEEGFSNFAGHELIYTEKLDGSNVCITLNDVFARSHAGPPGHKSFYRLKEIHSMLQGMDVLWEGYSIFGEWCYAVHSIKYSMLQHPLNIFGVRDDETGEWLSWDDVVTFAKEIGAPTVPVILRGAVASKEEIQKIVEDFAQLSSIYGPIREGLVIRKADAFTDFETSVVKWVRKDHVETDEHWTKKPVERQPLINFK